MSILSLDPDNYICSGDHIIAVPRSSFGDALRGHVLAIEGSAPGRREYIVELDGQHAAEQGAFGLPENRYVFSVLRGDAYVLVPGYLLPEEAEAKLQRAEINTRKRIEKHVPLFASQIPVEVLSVEEYIANDNQSRVEQLQRNHDSAERSTYLRDRVCARVTPEQFEQLQHARSRYPQDGSYGAYFWKRQLEHIEATGEPDIYKPIENQIAKTRLAWVKPGAELTWSTAEGGPKKVRVDFVGATRILAKIQGRAIEDYDPRKYPYGNVWLSPADIAEGTALQASA